MTETSRATRSFPISPAVFGLAIVGFFALAVSFSERAALGLAIPIWEKDFGWSRSFISGVGAIALIVVACVAPFAGALVDRRGPRIVLLLGLATLGVGSFLVAAVESRFLLIVAFGLVSAVGFGLVANHVVATAIVRATDTARGLATGIATSGSTAGQLAIVPLLAALLTVVSWRWSFVAAGIAALVLMPVVTRVLPRQPAAPAQAVSPAMRQGIGGDFRYLARQPTFHLLFWSFFLCGMTSTGVIETHFIPYAVLCGFPPLASATAYGLLSLFNFGGMVLSGWLTDRMNRPLLLASIYVLRGLAFILLVNVGSSYEWLIIFAVAFGVVDYATVPVTASLVASHLGLRIMGLAMGLISGGHAVGAALGAFLGGVLFDLSGRYDWLWWGSLFAAVVAGSCVWFIREQAREGSEAIPAH